MSAKLKHYYIILPYSERFYRKLDRAYPYGIEYKEFLSK